MIDEGQVTRARLIEEIGERVGQYLDTFDGFEGDFISAWYLVAEAVKPDDQRSILEISDAHSSKFTALGLLHAALHDSRWGI